MFKNIFFIFLIIVLFFSCSNNEKYISKRILIKDSLLKTNNIIKTIEPYKVSIDSIMNKNITFCKIDMKKGTPESLLGNFVSDLIFKKAQDIDNSVEFCILNNGGLRSPLYKGTITLRNIFELMLEATDPSSTATIFNDPPGKKNVTPIFQRHFVIHIKT